MTGQGCFRENLTLFADAITQPEKFNHYNGLLQMATQIDDMERRLKNIENMLSAIYSRVN